MSRKIPPSPFPESFRKIGIAAPASPADGKRLQEGIRILKDWGLEVVCSEPLFRKTAVPYLAATDEVRAEALNRFFRDSSFQAVLCVRGGYGSPRILPLIDWDSLRANQTAVIGFSDITALHFAMTAKGAGRAAASQMAARMPLVIQSASTLRSMRRMYAVIAGKTGPFKQQGPRLSQIAGSVPEKKITGPLLAANLSLAASLCGTEYMPSTKDCILVLEDIGDPVRIIDRHLNQLLLSGYFKKASALVFGGFTECRDHRFLMPMLREFALKTGIPVFSGLRFSHDLPFISILNGETAQIQPDGTFCLADPKLKQPEKWRAVGGKEK